MPISEIIVAAGSLTALAEACGCSPANISQLKRRRSFLPPRFVIAVEDITGIPRTRLRPDIYPVDQPSISHSKRPLRAARLSETT